MIFFLIESFFNHARAEIRDRSFGSDTAAAPRDGSVADRKPV
jgi:hypothetical protein